MYTLYPVNYGRFKNEILMMRMGLLVVFFTQDLIKNQVALNVFTIIVLFVSYPLCLQEEITSRTFMLNCLIIIFLNLFIMLYCKMLNTLAQDHITNFDERNSLLYI